MITIAGHHDIEHIGRGGLGDVYRATRTSTGGIVAVKVLRDVSDESVAWHRTRRELTALVMLAGHANVISLLELSETEQGPALVMEYAPGGSVGDLSEQRGGPLTVAEVVLVGRHVAAALSAAHAHHIVHRDVKPHNLLIDGYGQVKVCDFGIASLARSDEFRARTSALSMRYASPEDLDEDAVVGPPSDVYSLGATLLHLARGAPPSLKERLVPWIAPSTDATAAAALDQVIAACLHPVPARRPDADDVLARLEHLDRAIEDRCRSLVVAPRPAEGLDDERVGTTHGPGAVPPDPIRSEPDPDRIGDLPGGDHDDEQLTTSDDRERERPGGDRDGSHPPGSDHDNDRLATLDDGEEALADRDRDASLDAEIDGEHPTFGANARHIDLGDSGGRDGASPGPAWDVRPDPATAAPPTPSTQPSGTVDHPATGAGHDDPGRFGGPDDWDARAARAVRPPPADRPDLLRARQRCGDIHRSVTHAPHDDSTSFDWIDEPPRPIPADRRSTPDQDETVRRPGSRPTPKPVAPVETTRRWMWIATGLAVAVASALVTAAVWRHGDGPVPSVEADIERRTVTLVTVAPTISGLATTGIGEPTTTTTIAETATPAMPIEPASERQQAAEQRSPVVVVDGPARSTDLLAASWPLGGDGECLTIVNGTDRLAPSTCSAPHDLQRITTGQLDDTVARADATFDVVGVRAAVITACERRFAEFIDRDPTDSDLWMPVTLPSAETWPRGDRSYQCLVGVPDHRLVGDAAGSGR
ncbi:MAG: protein kinase [Ilumatobacteraceae bacterium]